MQKQADLERERVASVDAAAEPTAELLSFLFTLDVSEERQRRVLERLGYCMGRWIYLIDAADDLEKDRKSGNYNPFLLATDETDIAVLRERAGASLNGSLAECKAAYELLTIRRFDGILRNVLDFGMAAVWETVKKGEKNREQSV